MSTSTSSLPLPTVLSYALVAFTIEFDNEAEHRMPHRTSNYGVVGDRQIAPWLVSLAMWENCMRYVSEEGVTVRELEQLARTSTNLNGMLRWRYIVLKPHPEDHRPKPPESEMLIHPTAGGRKAQEVWRSLTGIIEARWSERFGPEAIEELREALTTIVTQLDPNLPDCMPIQGYGLFTPNPKSAKPGAASSVNISNLSLPALLARCLVAFATEFEQGAAISLSITANVLRVLRPGVRVRDLPRLSGVSKEAIAMALGFLEKRGYTIVVPEAPESRVKVVMLTAEGLEAQQACLQRVGEIEARWRNRYGESVFIRLCNALEHVVGDSARLMQGLEPYPEGWRSRVPRPECLPHFPMVLHRGGYPDGS
jgi:DNA-binding MarR family transcriptional regulator